VARHDYCEINRGYLEFIKGLANIHPLGRASKGKSLLRKICRFCQLLTIPLIYILGTILILFLKIKLLFNAKEIMSKVRLEAINHIHDFIPQYPMHLYPIVAKCLEINFIKNNISKMKASINGQMVEFAIGDGSLSRKIFSPNDDVIALDLNPYSLEHVKDCPHVVGRVVADCLNPPIIKSGAGGIVCLNLLHHITDKEGTLENWAQIAPYALFNENTGFWASSWAKPYLLKLLGLSNLAAKASAQIEKKSLQSLRTAGDLDILVENYYNIIYKDTFFSEKTFFYCSLFSALLFCYGPPTPKHQKLIMTSIFWPLTKCLTFQLAKLLIKFDAIQDREKDTYIIWFIKSKLITPESVKSKMLFICPECHEILKNNSCSQCGKDFEIINDMLFLLPQELSREISNYRGFSGVLNKEHL
jgi:hypothetical protein